MPEPKTKPVRPKAPEKPKTPEPKKPQKEKSVVFADEAVVPPPPTIVNKDEGRKSGLPDAPIILLAGIRLMMCSSILNSKSNEFLFKWARVSKIIFKAYYWLALGSTCILLKFKKWQ
jgi:hypothetical protein